MKILHVCHLSFYSFLIITKKKKFVSFFFHIYTTDEEKEEQHRSLSQREGTKQKAFGD